ncbi:hypothetical protein BDZ45DRAFT_698856 [Acephala macrosclerotiorum]|nr:hypothetical protein BDZ45DRAFT_698856 [Acephala macrosclerotiorum]
MPPRKAMSATLPPRAISASSPLSVASRAATIPPIHPGLKRKRSLAPESSPSKKRRGDDGAILRSVAKYGYDASDAFEYPSSGWIAISTVVPHDIELYGELESEEDEGEDEEEDDKIDDDGSCHSIKSTPPPQQSPDESLEVPDSEPSSCTASPVVLSRTNKNAHLPGSDAALNDENPMLRPAIDLDSDELWNIDGLDVHAVMKKGSRTKFTPPQEKKILLWMRKNETRGIMGHEESYNKLMTELKFVGQGQSKEVETALRHKVKGRINTLYDTLKKQGIVTDIDLDTERWQENNKIEFADYTVTWLREGWDGTMEVPRSWWTGTVEWDGVQRDTEPELFTVEEPPKLSTPQRPKKGPARINVTSNAVVVDVLGEIQQFWTKEIGNAKREADMKLDKDIWAHDMLYESEWNAATVQAQHIEVDMSKKILLEGPIDVLEDVVESNQNSRAEDMIRSVWNYGLPSVRFTASHEFTSAIVTPESEIEDPLMGLLSSSEPEVDEPKIQHQIPSTTGRVRKPVPSVESSRTQAKYDDVETDREDTGAEDSDEDDSENEDAAKHVFAGSEALDHEEAGLEEDSAEEDGVEGNYADEEDNAVEEGRISDTEMKDVDCESVTALQPIPPYEVICLTCDTYPKWASQLRDLLSAYDAWGVLTKEIKAPVPFPFADGVAFDSEKVKYDMAAKKWRRKSALCLDWMLLTMGKEVTDAVIHVQDPVKLWALLRDEFEVL